jgi:hypothetical protein
MTIRRITIDLASPVAFKSTIKSQINKPKPPPKLAMVMGFGVLNNMFIKNQGPEAKKN